MATKKVVKDEVVDETKVSKTVKDDAELNKVKQENEAMKSELEQLKSMMLQVMAQNNVTQQTTQSNNFNEKIKIGSNSWGRLILLDLNGNESVDFDDMGSIVNVPVRTFDSVIMKLENKKLMQSGIIYFVDESKYEEYGIAKPLIPTEEAIIDVLNSKDVLNGLYEITGKESDETLKYIVFWQIIRILVNGKCTNPMAQMSVTQFFNVENITNSMVLYQQVGKGSRFVK